MSYRKLYPNAFINEQSDLLNKLTEVGSRILNMSVTFLHIFQDQKYFKRNINANRILRNQYQIILIGISHDGGILKENKSINKNTIHLKNQN